MDDDGRRSDRVAALSAMYEADRADLAGLTANQLAVVSTLITYLGIAVAVLTLPEEPQRLTHQVAAYLAVPLWALLIYAAFLAPISARRSDTAWILEERLLIESGLESMNGTVGLTATVGAAQPRIRGAGLASRVLPWLFLTLAAMVIGFTIVSVQWSIGHISNLAIGAMCAVYALLFLLTATTWLLGIREHMGLIVR